MSELTPYVCVADARAAVAWYTQVLGAEVTVAPIEMPDGRIGHLELAIAGAAVMVSDAFPEVGVEPPDPDRGNPVTLHLTVVELDRLVARATDAGARLDRGPEDNPGIGRIAVLRDPFGHRWFLNQELQTSTVPPARQ